MSSCEQIQLLISQLIDRELNKEESALVAEHLKSCEDCAAMYRAFSALSSCLSEDLEEPPESLRENVMAEIRRGEMAKKNRRLSRPVRSLLAAAACMALIIGLAYGTAPFLRSPAARETVQDVSSAAARSSDSAGDREAVVLMAGLSSPDEPSGLSETASEAEGALFDDSAPVSDPDGGAQAPAAGAAYGPEASSGTVTVEAPDVPEAPKSAPASSSVQDAAPDPSPVQEEKEDAVSGALFRAAPAPSANIAADFIELWDEDRQAELTELLKGRFMTISARVEETEALSEEELAETPTYIFSLDEDGQRQINVYIRDGKVYYADSAEGYMLPANCTVEELEAFLG